MSDSALVAAIRPNAYGSSTIGVKKSTVCTIARSSVSCTTPASSAVSAATSTRGSLERGSEATIGRRSAADSLQPQPAPCEREVRGAVIGSYDAPPCPSATPTPRSTLRSRPSATLRAWRRRSGSSRPARRSFRGSSTRRSHAADWFGSAHQAEVLRAAGQADPDERVAAVRNLVAEETRLSMLVGVAVGYELGQMLKKGD